MAVTYLSLTRLASSLHCMAASLKRFCQLSAFEAAEQGQGQPRLSRLMPKKPIKIKNAPRSISGQVLLCNQLGECNATSAAVAMGSWRDSPRVATVGPAHATSQRTSPTRLIQHMAQGGPAQRSETQATSLSCGDVGLYAPNTQPQVYKGLTYEENCACPEVV